jgi:hypothetical protein
MQHYRIKQILHRAKPGHGPPRILPKICLAMYVGKARALSPVSPGPLCLTSSKSPCFRRFVRPPSRSHGALHGRVLGLEDRDTGEAVEQQLPIRQ